MTVLVYCDVNIDVPQQSDQILDFIKCVITKCRNVGNFIGTTWSIHHVLCGACARPGESMKGILVGKDITSPKGLHSFYSVEHRW